MYILHRKYEFKHNTKQKINKMGWTVWFQFKLTLTRQNQEKKSLNISMCVSLNYKEPMR